ncbi:MAG: cupin domain-containing protein [Burkholderiales bacterium]|nr:cupin domain-containing protein [Burkholderiales bacterium]
MTTPSCAPALNINDLKRFSPLARVNLALLQSKDLVTRMNCYEPGQVTPVHMHPEHDEIVFCVEGRGRITFAGLDEVPLSPGSLALLPAGIVHGIEAAPDSRMVVIYVVDAGYTSVRPSAPSVDASIRLPGEKDLG